MTDNVNADYVSSPEAARILRITYVGVAQLARQGKIPAVKIANRWLIPRAFLEEFARTYAGRRGRPRKNQLAGCPRAMPEVQPSHADTADLGATVHSSDTRIQAGGIPGPEAQMRQPAACPPAATESGPVRSDEMGTPGAGHPEAEVDRTAAVNLQTDLQEEAPACADQTNVSGAADANQPALTEASAPEGDRDFAVSAEVFHLDGNYDFEVYEKGQITERARLIVARLKPKIPSLPQFSFRWDYRYEHLNVDIHGVDPAVTEWWTMGENGYTGHLPRRLGGPGYAFEAIIWLPVTFVFRGRLTLSLRGSPEAQEDSPSAPVTTGGLRRLWTKWSTLSGNT